MELPFDPASVTIEDLAQRLEDEDTDEETTHALQRADTRKGAAAVYERRVDAITESQDSAPEPVEAPAPPEPSGTEEDKARGYRITQWAGYDNFECLYCPFKHLDVDKVVRHTAQHR